MRKTILPNEMTPKVETPLVKGFTDKGQADFFPFSPDAPTTVRVPFNSETDKAFIALGLQTQGDKAVDTVIVLAAITGGGLTQYLNLPEDDAPPNTPSVPPPVKSREYTFGVFDIPKDTVAIEVVHHPGPAVKQPVLLEYAVLWTKNSLDE